jgi:endonuclease/exonuclease/phosphatase family metal-dependent hydrolase
MNYIIKQTITAKQIFCALLALILPLIGVVPLPELGAKGPVDADVVRVMSFNVRNSEFDREEIVPQLIADYMPDSAGLQECEGTWRLTLETYLPGYTIVGVGRLTGTKLIGESTAIMFRNDKYNLVDWGTFWLSETPDKVSKGWDAAYPRTCTWAVLENKVTGERYAHINTHLDNAGLQAKINGIDLILEKAVTFDMPVVLTGDFNFGKGTALYRQLNSGCVKDSAFLAEKADSGATSHGYQENIEAEAVDIICVSSKVKNVKSYNIIREKYNGRFVSDHYPIYSDIVM